jgi:hypothetical protein
MMRLLTAVTVADCERARIGRESDPKIVLKEEATGVTRSVA